MGWKGKGWDGMGTVIRSSMVHGKVGGRAIGRFACGLLDEGSRVCLKLVIVS